MFSSPTVLEPLLKSMNFSVAGTRQLTYTLDDGASHFILEKLTEAPISANSYYSRAVNFVTDQIAYAGYGGCIAVVHAKLESDEVAPIDVYDSAMNHVLALFPPSEMCNSSGILVRPDGFFITPEEMIVMIKGGMMWVFNTRGHLVVRTHLFDDDGATFVLFTAFYENGVFVVTTTGSVWHVEDFTKCRVQRAGGSEVLVHAEFGVAMPAYSGSAKAAHGPVLVVPLFDRSDAQWKIAFVQNGDVQVINFVYPILKLVFSPSHTQAVVVTEGGVIIYSYDFSECYMKLNLVDMNVRNVVWLGDSHLVAVMDDQVRILGDAWHPLELGISGECFVVSEVDGARIITKDNVYLIREVKGPALDILLNHPGSLISDFLYIGSDVQKLVKKKVHKNLKNVMKPATDGIMGAVEFFQSPEVCNYLLDVCLRVKPYIQNFDLARFLTIVNEHRVLRFIAKKPVSMRVTEEQFRALGASRMIVRLCNRNQHLLALRIAEFLQLPSERVYANWASSLIISDASTKVIREKLDSCSTGLDYTELALLAYERQGLDFAIEILRKNKLPSKSVPILVRWNRWSEAMKLALDSNDMSLLEYVMRRAEAEVEANPTVKKDLDEALKKNKPAMTVWQKMHPDKSMETFAAELVAFAENPSKEKFERLTAMAPTDTAKQALSMIKKMNEVCKDKRVPWARTPYEIIDKVIRSQGPHEVKTAAEALKLSKDEVAWRKLEVAASWTDKEKDNVKQLIREAVEVLKPDEIANAILKFREDKDSISELIYHAVPEKAKPELDHILESSKSKHQYPGTKS